MFRCIIGLNGTITDKRARFMDPLTAIVVAAGAVGTAAVSTSKEVMVKILGPTADYLGDELLQWTQQRQKNVGRIVQNAESKLGDRINDEGAVPPKVLKEILDDGSFAEDDLAVEYFGGVLASSRSGMPRDDRGAAFAKLVAQLTSYQLRTHYCFYSHIKQVHNGKEKNLMVSSDRRELEVFIPFTTYYSALDFTPEEDWAALLPHAIFGLGELGLIGESWQYGDAEDLRAVWPLATEAGIIVGPSPLGTELFLWAHGLGCTPAYEFLSEDVVLRSDFVVSTAQGVTSTSSELEAPDQS